jgi:hypothetical protein
LIQIRHDVEGGEFRGNGAVTRKNAPRGGALQRLEAEFVIPIMP